MTEVSESKDAEMRRPLFINTLFQENWSAKQQNQKNTTETEAEETEIVDQMQKAKITTPTIYYNVYVSVNKVELKQIVDGYIETHDKYIIRCRDEMLILMKQGHEHEKKWTELKELEGELLELKRLNKLETTEWEEFTVGWALREYQKKNITLVNQLMELKTTIAKAVEKSVFPVSRITFVKMVWNKRLRK